jgi:hypothetical protein
MQVLFYEPKRIKIALGVLDKEIVNIEPGEWGKLDETLTAHQNKIY